MEVSIQTPYTFDDAIGDTGQSDCGCDLGDVLTVQLEGRFFIGYGCEEPSGPNLPEKLIKNRKFLLDSHRRAKRNISICID